MIDDNRGLGRTRRVLDRMIAYLRKNPERRCTFLVHSVDFGHGVVNERLPPGLITRITVVSNEEAARGQTTFVDHAFIEQHERKHRNKIAESDARIDDALRTITNERVKQRSAETRIGRLSRIEEMSVR